MHATRCTSSSLDTISLEQSGHFTSIEGEKRRRGRRGKERGGRREGERGGMGERERKREEEGV